MMVALPGISLSLRVFGYGRVRRWIERTTARNAVRAPNPTEIAEGERLARLASMAGRHGPVAASCLRQALLIHGLLRRRGLQSELMIGVYRDGGGMSAHAWVELGGVQLAQTSMRHAPFLKHPAPTC